jgi:hypothetical protein
MKKDNFYTLLIILMVGMYLTNFLVIKLSNRTLFGGTTISIITGSILFIKDRVNKNQKKKLN